MSKWKGGSSGFIFKRRLFTYEGRRRSKRGDYFHYSWSRAGGRKQGISRSKNRSRNRRRCCYRLNSRSNNASGSNSSSWGK